jgi:hypothetical protein
MNWQGRPAESFFIRHALDLSSRGGVNWRAAHPAALLPRADPGAARPGFADR